MSNSVEIKATDHRDAFMDTLLNLDSDTFRKVMNVALSAAASRLKKDTISKLRQKLGSVADTPSKKYGFKLTDGVRMKKSVYDINVNIMGDYRLKWYENGTQPRQTKEGYNRGSMKAINFFSEARAATPVDDIIRKSITAFMDKLKKKGQI